jgi:hypothetical protein
MSHVISTAVSNGVKTVKQFWKDFYERAGSTFWQAAVPVLVAAPATTNWSALKIVGAAAFTAGCGALLSMAKSLIVRRRGIENSASASKSV